MMSSCSGEGDTASERERGGGKGEKNEWASNLAMANLCLQEGSLLPSVFNWILLTASSFPRFNWTNQRPRLWETKKNAQNFHNKTQKALQKRKKSAPDGSRSRDLTITRLMSHHSATEADGFGCRPPNTDSDLQIPIPFWAQCVFFFSRIFGNFDVSSLYTEHESVLFWSGPLHAASG